MQSIAPDIERYLAGRDRSTPLLETGAAEGAALGLPNIDSTVGSLLHAMVVASGANSVLEIGTANGYSTLWRARALSPSGRLISIEMDADRAVLARGHLATAGLANQVSVMVGDAARLVHKIAGPFDLIFNDGDKLQYEPLHDRLVELLRPGGLLITDNVLWEGEVVPGLVSTPQRNPAETAAIAAFNPRLAGDSRLATSFLPVRDGVAIAIRRPVEAG